MSFYSSNCISCSVVCKVYFFSEFPVIPEKWWTKKKNRDNYEASCFSGKRKNNLGFAVKFVGRSNWFIYCLFDKLPCLNISALNWLIKLCDNDSWNYETLMGIINTEIAIIRSSQDFIFTTSCGWIFSCKFSLWVPLT